MKTMIAIPCMDTMPTGFVQSLLYLEKGTDTSVYFKANSLVYDSRNLLSLSAIEDGFDNVLWIDSDMMFTNDSMKILLADMTEYNCDMVTGVYFRRRRPHTPVVFRTLDEPARDENGTLKSQLESYDDYPRDQIFPVKGCGFGFCMTSVRLLKEVWGKYGPAFAPFPWGGEDISFCHRVNQLGYTILCDSRVTCGHIGTTVCTEDDFIQEKRGGAH